MQLPKWLYNEKRVGGLRVVRYGSRRPLRFVLTIVEEGSILDGLGADSKYALPPSYLFAIGKLGVQVGPEVAVTEGWMSMPRGSRCKLFSLRNGIGIGLTWEGS